MAPALSTPEASQKFLAQSVNSGRSEAKWRPDAFFFAAIRVCYRSAIIARPIHPEPIFIQINEQNSDRSGLSVLYGIRTSDHTFQL